MKDKTKYSLASKKRWVGVSKKERTRRMTELALIRSAKMTYKEKVKHAYKMIYAKNKKNGQ